MIEEINFLKYLTEFSLIYFVVLQGSIAKEYLRILNTRTGKIPWWKVLFASVFGSITIFSLLDHFLKYFTPREMMFVSFIAGLIGFQLLEKLSTLEGVKDMIRYFMGDKGGGNGGKDN